MYVLIRFEANCLIRYFKHGQHFLVFYEFSQDPCANNFFIKECSYIYILNVKQTEHQYLHISPIYVKYHNLALFLLKRIDSIQVKQAYVQPLVGHSDQRFVFVRLSLIRPYTGSMSSYYITSRYNAVLDGTCMSL